MDNPLADQQREKKGAETFAKYEYQYHWALNKLLEEHKQYKEYAIFVELHEDVVLSNSLQKETAEFEFYQVKENSGSTHHTENTLTAVNANNQNSILGKLIQSYYGKAFKDVISSINLVATSGFSSKMIKKELKLEEITFKDLKLKSLAKFKKNILQELSLEECPVNIRFIVPKLLPAAKREMVIAAIVDLISTLYPNTQCDAHNIYRVLIDELHRKGEVTYDYNNWNSLLKNKALTSDNVQKTIEAHSSIKKLQEVRQKAESFILELNLKFLDRRELLKSVESYYVLKLARRSGWTINLSNEVQKLCYGFKHLDNAELILNIANTLSESLKKNIPNEQELKAAIICELIVDDI